MEEKRKEIKSYVLRASRMSRGQREALEKYSERYCIPYKGEETDFRGILNRDRICFEVGFGMGQATAEIAGGNPETGYIGIEVHSPGVGRLLGAVEEKGLENVRIINHDAVEVLRNMVAESSVDGFHIFFPDPWPKKKHHKRRLIQAEFTKLLVSRLRVGGYIYAATDWEDYALQMMRVFEAEEGLKNCFDGWAGRIDWRPETSFERKGIEKDHIIRELYFMRVK